MPPRRPTSVLVIAIFHFIVGGIGVMSDLCGTFAVAGGNKLFSGLGGPQQAQQTAELEKAMKEKVPGYEAYQIGILALSWLFDVALISAGVGLLRMKPWARTLSLVYAVISLLAKVFVAVYTILYLAPATAEAVKAALPPQGAGPQAAQAQQVMSFATDIAKITAVATPFLSMIYPLAVLIVLGRPSIGAAFRGERVGRDDERPDEPEDYRDPDAR
jgi:hypothetical protein